VSPTVVAAHTPARTGRSGALATVTELLDLRPFRGGPVPAGRALLGVVAGRSGPRFLVPLDHPAAAPEACLAYLALRDRRTRLTRGAVGLALRAGLGGLVLRDRVTADAGPGSLVGRLAELVADPDEEPGLAVAVGLGHADDVWKPTLQVFRPDGEPAAFVKVGVGPVAAHLVEAEADALARWGDHPDPRLLVPGLRATEVWAGHPVAVVDPLPLDARRLPVGTVSPRPVRDLDGPPSRARVAQAGWWTGRRDAAGKPEADLLAAIEERHGEREGTWARWHGDWVPWNLARCHRGLIAWDWEYSEPGAPMGLDEVHGAYQQARVVGGRSIAGALAAARAEARRVAASLALEDHADPDGGAWLADAHVAMLVTRDAEVARLAGRPTAQGAQLLAAARGAVHR
jgi:hypothetical protein